jgi:hypothetical protein
MPKRIGRRLTDFLPKSRKSSLAKRKRLAKRLRAGRTRDSQSREYHAPKRSKWNIERSVGSLGLLGDFLKSRLEAVNHKHGRKKVSVLDLGAGEGFLSDELCMHIPKHRLRLDVLSLTRPTTNVHRYVDTGERIMEQTPSPTRILVGSLENYRFSKKYDFIFSVAGAVPYSVNIPIAVEKICNTLNVGGEAVLHVKPTKFVHLIPLLRRAGFSVKRIRGVNEGDCIFHITNNKGRTVSFNKQIKSALQNQIKTRHFVDIEKN